jgi:hypothetical protein
MGFGSPTSEQGLCEALHNQEVAILAQLTMPKSASSFMGRLVDESPVGVENNHIIAPAFLFVCIAAMTKP